MREDRGREERRTQEDLGNPRGKHLDKCKLKTALERVVFTSSKTARLELTKSLDAGKNCFNLGLRVISGLTFGPKLGAIDKG